ncbi:hypothetical protein G2W53_021052 [Senna tora]|uniref:Uncharacterized protein n=1 Tax=Senna tora TaxID=362788 RepID=A0A834TIU8_9FABA|nr:hypothetical protein G2W53_021052 [Senna tora]
MSPAPNTHPSRTHTTYSPKPSFSSPSSQTPHESHSTLPPHVTSPANYANHSDSSNPSNSETSLCQSPIPFPGSTEHIDPLVVPGGPSPDDVDLAAAQGGGFGDADTCGGVEEGGDSVIGGVLEHDFVEEGGLAVAAGAAVLGVLVVVEGVVGGLYEVAAAKDELAEIQVERLKQAFPILASQEFGPCRMGLGLGFGGRHDNNGTELQRGATKVVWCGVWRWDLVWKMRIEIGPLASQRREGRRRLLHEKISARVRLTPTVLYSKLLAKPSQRKDFLKQPIHLHQISFTLQNIVDETFRVRFKYNFPEPQLISTLEPFESTPSFSLNDRTPIKISDDASKPLPIVIANKRSTLSFLVILAGTVRIDFEPPITRFNPGHQHLTAISRPSVQFENLLGTIVLLDIPQHASMSIERPHKIILERRLIPPVPEHPHTSTPRLHPVHPFRSTKISLRIVLNPSQKGAANFFFRYTTIQELDVFLLNKRKPNLCYQVISSPFLLSIKGAKELSSHASELLLLLDPLPSVITKHSDSVPSSAGYGFDMIISRVPIPLTKPLTTRLLVPKELFLLKHFGQLFLQVHLKPLQERVRSLTQMLLNPIDPSQQLSLSLANVPKHIHIPLANFRRKIRDIGVPVRITNPVFLNETLKIPMKHPSNFKAKGPITPPWNITKEIHQERENSNF